MKLFATSVLALTVLSCAALAEEFKGTIADSHCAASQVGKVISPDHAKCAAACIKKGAEAVLVTDEGKVYKLDDQKKGHPPRRREGHRGRQAGDGDTIKVASIETT